MKKGIEWLHELSKKDQVLFLKNLSSPDVGRSTSRHCDRNIAKYLNHDFISFDRFISYAFTWRESTEGDTYWWRISVKQC